MLLSKPYPNRYEPPTFMQYNGRKGRAIENMNKCVDTMGPFIGDEDLCLHKFSKSLCDHAYTWYTSLKPGSIPTQDEMVDVFCSKYFHAEETMMPTTLQGIKQRNGEDLMKYIKRFRDIAPDLYDHFEERTLVEICMGNMIMEYQAVLENLEISQFAQLLQKVRKTAQSFRPNSKKPKDRKSTPQAMAVSTHEKRKRLDSQGLQVQPHLQRTH